MSTGEDTERLTCRVMCHSLCQHCLPTARWAVHEDSPGRVDADLREAKDEPGDPVNNAEAR